MVGRVAELGSLGDTNKIIPAFMALALVAASPAFAVDSHAKDHDPKKNGTHAASHKSKAHKGKTHSPHTGKKSTIDPTKSK